MKKLYLSLFTISMLSLSGCGSTSNTTIQQSEPTVFSSSEEVTTEEVATEEVTSEEVTSEEVTSEQSVTIETDNDVYSVSKALFDKGLLTGVPTQMAADIIHAVSGVKYSDQGVEIYEYDVESDAYKALANGESISLEGLDGYFVSASAINGKFVLIFSDKEDQSIIDAFSSLNLE